MLKFWIERRFLKQQAACVAALMLIALVLSASPSRAQDLSETYCSTVQNILVGQTFGLREEGVPIGSAEETMNTFRDVDERLWTFAMASVQSLYEDSDKMRRLIESGDWLYVCSHVVRGY